MKPGIFSHIAGAVLPRVLPAAAAGLLALSGCAVQTPPQHVEANAPPQWQAPLPHQGSVSGLADWWQRQGDPVLVELITAAESVSPTLATARTRIAQARAERVSSGAALLPTLDGAASVSRASQQSSLPLGTTTQLGLQTAWEIDVFGGGRASRDAAQLRLDSAQAGWHDARVSVAAEVANQYYSLRACQRLLAVARQDAASRADTARLTGLMADAGFQAPANAALARASAAEGSNRVSQQRAQCDTTVKALVALTALPEPRLRSRLEEDDNAQAGPVLDDPAPIAIAALPAQTLSQRPDVFTAQSEVAAASFEVGGARAQRYPSLGLSGQVGVANFRSSGINTKLDVWTIGPLTLGVPIFDGGRRRANIDAAVARYDEAATSYRSTVRQAVREVEEALIKLQSTEERAADARTALEGYRSAFTATEDRYKNGMASLLELEDARRTRLAAENTLVSLQQERRAAWVALYRAAGGGWTPPSSPAQAANSDAGPGRSQ
jgi:NodT family efflux transporter outer membrane factor (OMF) lipoprotein